MCVQTFSTPSGTISASHLFPSKSSPNSQVAMTPKNAVNKLLTKLARANLIINLSASTKIDVLAHAYDTMSKTKILEEAQAQTLSVFNNSLYDTSFLNSEEVSAP